MCRRDTVVQDTGNTGVSHTISSGLHAKQPIARQHDLPQLLSYGFNDRLEGVPDLLWVHEHFVTGAGKGSCSLFKKRKMSRDEVLLLWRLWALSGVCTEALL